MTYQAPYLIAHRGYPALYPENSLAGLEAAMEAGACFVEMDVQLSRERTPYLCHDDHLGRLAGLDICLTQLDDDAIEGLAVPYPAAPHSRSKTADRTAPIARLSTFCQLLPEWPHVTAFIEIKAESIARFGLETTVAAISDVVYPLREQCVMISFDRHAIGLIRERGMARIGWVIERWHNQQLAFATELAPDYLFCGTDILPQQLNTLWPGPWQWVIYSVNDYATVLQYAQAGFMLIETDTIGTLLEYPLLRRACATFRTGDPNRHQN
ncbi:glycerophosphodiester phosphodiesterase family protein [Nitrosomonas halophila]|uniref:Glycerophosphoryl diester phosphodiesterase n=1 Tax=Nitrosomonas halophila TaxID=44576 RepID=A0A1H3PEW6_9PROT|nr:glycerophosphodiester phosphodiesterase family protein [Nitrosomonas halophila]SDY99712.1 glycerophosphoryl diester phosphodiesterase [Nitrosomonas halophila]